MKFCSHCGAELRDEAILCTKCGCSVNAAPVRTPEPATPSVRYCNYCGAEVLPAAVVCTKCGCPLKPQGRTGTGTGWQTAARVLMVVACALWAVLAGIMAIGSIILSNTYAAIVEEGYLGFNPGTSLLIAACCYLIPLAWSIPMTRYYFTATKNKQPVGIGFKVCSLLFVNLIAGILMLCDTSNNK